MTRADARQLLGKRTPAAFLARYWQKRSLLVRQALPAFGGILSPDELFRIAGRDDVDSRLIVRERGGWSLSHGPFARSTIDRLPRRNWTLLVQDVNRVHAAADALLRSFSFIPFARMDDLMVSYAAPGGGVGPHFDSYDVFLLQGRGRRRWRYGRQRDLSLEPDLPLKILRRFTPRDDAVLEPGDMLYLPPQYAHDGVAVDACTTYSIGFRAPAHQELVETFLDFLRDRIVAPGRYEDPDLRATRTPGRIDVAMQRAFAQTLSSVRWDRTLVRRFVGCMLSEPKQSALFSPPRRPLTPRRFGAAIAGKGCALDRGTQLLYDNDDVYVNGAVVEMTSDATADLRRLADARALSAAQCARLAAATIDVLYQWYRHGYVTTGSARV